MKKSLIALSLVLGASAALAEGFFDKPAAYGGVGFASTHFDDDDQFDGLDVDTRDNGLHVFGGYQFNPYFAVELSARDLGEYTTGSGAVYYKERFTATTVGGIGFLPLGSGFSLYGRAGLGAVTLEEKVSYAGGRDNEDDTGGVSSIGAGLEYRNSGLALRLGWESHFFTVQTTRLIVIGNTAYFDDDEYHQRIDSFGLDIAYYFSL